MTDLLPRATGAPSAATPWRERDATVISTAYGRYSDLVVERASGSWLETVDSRRVLDLGCGIGVTNLGHGHPDVVAAVRRQAGDLWHTSVTALHPRMIEAAEALVAALPEGLDRVFWTNSGAEAVEGALKLARKATGRSEIVAFDGGFHGRTYGAVSLTASRSRYHAGMGPFLPGVHHVPYPPCGACIAAGTPARCRSGLRELERLLQTRVDPTDVAAVVVEPIQGEGGYLVPPDDFLRGLRRLCDRHGILLVADEVQSGMGRTGRFLAVEHAAVRPDIVTLAKGLGNGIPVAALVARREVMEAWQPGDHGTTYGGNALACAAVLAVLEVIARDHLLERAERLGAHVRGRALGWRRDLPGLVADVRGRGLMVGVELRRPDGSPAAAELARLRAAALAADVLVLSCGTEDNVIRLLPALTIAEADLDHGLDVVERCLAEVA